MLDSGGLATCEPLRKLAALSMDSDGLATCESLQSIGYVAAGCRGVPWRARSTPRGNPRFPSMGFEMRDSQDSGWPPAPDSTSQSASLTAPLSGEPYENWRRYRWIQTGSPRASPYGVLGTLPQAVGACRGAPAPLLGGISVFRPWGLKCVIHRTQAGSPRASPYDSSPIRGSNGGLRYLWYSNSME